jgi:dienelactone hydrolase
MKNIHFSLLLSMLVAAPACFAKEPPAAQIVELTAADGIRLKASYFSAGKPGPGVLLLHQCDHERTIWDGLARKLAGAGINVLTFDLRGFGDSGDRTHNKTGPLEPPEEMQKWPGDIDVAYQYLKSQREVKPDVIGVGGASCGVSNAIKTVMRHPEVKSLILLSGPSDLKDRQFLRQSKIPAFFAVSTDDPYPNMVQFTEWLYLITPNTGKRFAKYQTGGHGAEIFSVHPDLPATIVNWYVTTLIKTPGQAPASGELSDIPIEVRNWDLLEQPGGPAKLMQKLKESRESNAKAPFIDQQMIDYMANEHFEAGDVQQAVEISKLDIFAYPNSPVAYGVLAEAYLTQGQKDLARQNVQKALEVLPMDKVYPLNAHEAIKAGLDEILKGLK